jgi:hypothetical protein
VFIGPTASPGAVDLAPDLYADDESFPQPIVLKQGELDPDLHEDADVVHAPVVTSRATLLPDPHVDADVLFTASIPKIIALARYVDVDLYFGESLRRYGNFSSVAIAASMNVEENFEVEVDFDLNLELTN